MGRKSTAALPATVRQDACPWIDEFVGPVRKGILGEQANHYFQMILLSLIRQRKKRAIDVFFKGVMPPGWKG